MIRRFALSVAALAALALAGNAQAQARGGAAAPEGKAKVGFGVGIETTSVFQTLGIANSQTATPVMFYAPIQLTPQLRVEPQVGLFAFSNDAEDRSGFALGSGFFLTQPLSQNLELYVGPRLILDFVGGKDKATGTSGSAVDVSILAAAGVEYYLSNHFSVGAEGQFGYTSVGSIAAIGRASASIWATNALVFLRAYL